MISKNKPHDKEIKQFLSRFHKLNSMIKTKKNRLEELESLITSVKSTNYDSEKSISGNQKRKDDILVGTLESIEKLRENILSDIKDLIAIENEIRSVINLIPDYQCRFVLEQRYLNFKLWKEIATELSDSERSVYRRHNKGINYLKKKQIGSNWQ